MSTINERSTRRRSPIVAILAVIAALVALVLFSMLWNPLNSTEQILLGQWLIEVGDSETTRYLVFRRDRTFQLRSSKKLSGSGSWEATNGSLRVTLKDESPRSKVPPAVAWYLSPSHDEVFSVIDLKPDHVRMRDSMNTMIELKRVSTEE